MTVSTLLVAIALAAFDQNGSSGDVPAERAVYCADAVSAEYEIAPLKFLSSSAFTAFYANPYGVTGLRRGGCSGFVHRESSFVRAGWETFGNDFYQEKSFFCGAGFWRSTCSIGMEGRLFSVQIPGSENENHFYCADAAGAVSFRPVSSLRFTYLERNIAAHYWKRNTELLSPLRSGGIGYTPFDSVELVASLSYRLRRLYQIYQCSVNLTEAFAVQFSYSPELASSSVKANIYFKTIGITYSLSRHTVLGTTHYIGITVFGDHPSLSVPVAVANASSFTVPKEKIDIRSCSADELMSIPGMTDELAGRIINYREIFGELSKRALIQLGVEGELLNRVLASVDHLSENDVRSSSQRVKKGKGGKKKKRVLSYSRRKEFFSAMLSRGVRSSVAMRISLDSAKRSLAEIASNLNIFSLTEEEKKTVRELCREFSR